MASIRSRYMAHTSASRYLQPTIALSLPRVVSLVSALDADTTFKLRTAVIVALESVYCWHFGNGWCRPLSYNLKSIMVPFRFHSMNIYFHFLAAIRVRMHNAHGRSKWKCRYCPHCNWYQWWWIYNCAPRNPVYLFRPCPRRHHKGQEFASFLSCAVYGGFFSKELVRRCQSVTNQGCTGVPVGGEW